VKPPAAVRSRARRVVPLVLAALSASLVASGCLDDPPTFAPRGQIPPFIIAGQVDPPLGAIYQGPARIEINVPFRSEDQNFDLEARLYLDLLPGASNSPPEVVNAVLPAGNFEELRSLTMEWVLPVSSRCHSLTLILTYAGNFDLNGLPIDDSRAARLVWWLNIGDPEGEEQLAACPRAAQTDAVTNGP
jgi:hypothetical protein